MPLKANNKELAKPKRYDLIGADFAKPDDAGQWCRADDVAAHTAAKDAEIARLTAKAAVMTNAAKACEKLSMHYRTGTRPSVKLLKEVEWARKAIEMSDREAAK